MTSAAEPAYVAAVLLILRRHFDPQRLTCHTPSMHRNISWCKCSDRICSLAQRTRRLGEHSAPVPVTLTGPGGESLAGALVVARTQPCPARQMGCIPETGSCRIQLRLGWLPPQ
jgi:hypothetical protein